MTPVHRTRGPARPLLLALVLGLAAEPAHALRIANYNILNYPSLNAAGRDPHFRTILGPLGADVVAVQEMLSQAGVDEFLGSVLNTLEPGQWAAAPFVNGNDTDNALFYKPSKVQFLGGWSWYPPDNLRLVNCYRLKPVGYSAAAAELRIYSQHLKAGSGDTAQRLTEAISIRDSMNAMPAGTHAILLGDFNIYTGTEPAFQKLLENQADNDGQLYDPLDAPLITWNTASLATIHTQSPCLNACPGGFATGGLDDRFDMFLPTLNMNDGEGLELLVATYVPVGNDGLHYNLNITDPPTIPEGAAYASALINASDHLPIRVDVQLPAKLGAPASLAFGTVIVGGSADLAISNPAVVPADELDYAFAAPAGFSAPAGPFALEPGAPAASHAITVTPGGFGARAGDLQITTDDPDHALVLVPLTANVLDHAAASLDSLVALTASTLDFGAHPAGGFEDLLARVHNLGYDPLQARLSLQSANITGGDGRFSIVGGFSPALVAGTAASHSIHFDDAGATPDLLYEATLTFTSADEPLPGATAQPDLVVTLKAQVSTGSVSAPGSGLPAFTRLHAPYPNPVRGTATVGFDLAAPGRVRLEVFDLSGRRVATLASGPFEAGRHAVSWDGSDAGGGDAAPGLYFVRFSGPAGASGAARLVVTER